MNRTGRKNLSNSNIKNEAIRVFLILFVISYQAQCLQILCHAILIRLADLVERLHCRLLELHAVGKVLKRFRNESQGALTPCRRLLHCRVRLRAIKKILLIPAATKLFLFKNEIP